MKETEKNNFNKSIENSFKILESTLNGKTNSELHQIRKESFLKFAELGLPTRKIEDWKYNNLGFLNNITFDFKSNVEVKEEKTNFENYLINGIDNYIVVSNGHIVADNITNKKIKIDSSDNRFHNDEHLRKRIFSDSSYNSSITFMNNSLFTDGYYLEIADNTKDTIQVIYLNTSLNNLINVKNYLKLGENSELEIFEIVINNENAENFINIDNFFDIEKNSYLNHIRFLEDNSKSIHFNKTKIYQKTGSNYTNDNFDFGARFTRNDIIADHLDENLITNLNGLFIAKDKEFIDNHTKINHSMPNCESHELYKGILDGSSTGVFNGKIYVKKDAQKTNAFQSSKCILISDNAKMYAKPELEIYADDVKCSHGASTGQIDSDALFYLQARGIHKDEAYKLLLSAYAFELINKVKNPIFREFISNKMENKF